MTTSIPFIPGLTPAHSGPLWRFLPPIQYGVAQNWLSERLPPGSWILDPFGASPSLAVEAARMGYRVLVTANNPITRFLLELYADPPTKDTLRAALADLAATPKGSERIEPHIRGLYRTECSNCGAIVEAQAFIWERDATTPCGRIYQCQRCKESGEQPSNPGDAERAKQFSSGKLHRSRALERVVSLNDPDRAHVEEALEMYLPRAVYALFTLVNKLESAPPEQQRSLRALLLATFDHTNVLWSYPTKRARPRQLTVPQRFLEKNPWMALEGTVEEWTKSLFDRSTFQASIQQTIWPIIPSEDGGLCIFEGRLKDLNLQLQEKSLPDLRFDAVLTALPRPNQAYWTLSALWAGWLWGQEATTSYKSVLRRRRFDWSWHTVALQAALGHLAEILDAETPLLQLVGEAETGFLTAAILASKEAGFELLDVALRAENNQAQLHWKRSSKQAKTPDGSQDESREKLQETAKEAARFHLMQRGEPSNYIHIHTAALIDLAKSNSLNLSKETKPADLQRDMEDLLKTCLSFQGGFRRLTVEGHPQSQRSKGAGQWWLNQVVENEDPKAICLPLADRVEMDVVGYLLKHPEPVLMGIDQSLCNKYPGLLTPNQSLIQECLLSYAEEICNDQAGEQQSFSGGNRWRLRQQETPEARRNDLESMKNLLEILGTRLGFQVNYLEESQAAQPNRRLVFWKESENTIAYHFFLLASAVLGNIVFAERSPAQPAFNPGFENMVRKFIVVPGGRAGLISYKIHRDLRLSNAIVQAGWQFLKFRHLRWLVENETLNPDNLEEQLSLDPLASRDPQLPLF